MAANPRSTAYHRMSVLEKEATWRTGVAARELRRCGACGVQCELRQLADHERLRCGGVRLVHR